MSSRPRRQVVGALLALVQAELGLPSTTALVAQQEQLERGCMSSDRGARQRSATPIKASCYGPLVRGVRA